MSTELERERAALVCADRDIASGRDRVERQRELVMSGRLNRPDMAEAERLLATMEAALAEWERHRVLIVDRIAYLSRLGPARA
jgi:hypothetical protein